MSVYYSPATRGFYPGDSHYDVLPDDKVAIADEQYRNLINGQAEGKFIVPGESGMPQLVDALPESDEQARLRVLAERNARLVEAAIRIAPLQDAVDVEGSASGDELLLNSWKRYRIALNRIEQLPGFPHGLVWPERPGLTEMGETLKA
ncbi:tail fiber assembly protein [Achromobacter anxifer]